MDAKTVTVIVLHQSSIPGATWVTPKGWEPANKISGAEFVEGSWWGDDSEEAGLVAWNLPEDAAEGDEIDIDLSELRVALCGDCRVLAAVEIVD